MRSRWPPVCRRHRFSVRWRFSNCQGWCCERRGDGRSLAGHLARHEVADPHSADARILGKASNQQEETVAGRPVHTFEVVRTEQVTPHLTRVVLGGAGFDTFTPNDSTDAYVKIVFVHAGVDVSALDQPLTLDSFKALPAEQQ